MNSPVHNYRAGRSERTHYTWRPWDAWLSPELSGHLRNQTPPHCACKIWHNKGNDYKYMYIKSECVCIYIYTYKYIHVHTLCIHILNWKARLCVIHITVCMLYRDGINAVVMLQQLLRKQFLTGTTQKCQLSGWRCILLRSERKMALRIPPGQCIC